MTVRGSGARAGDTSPGVDSCREPARHRLFAADRRRRCLRQFTDRRSPQLSICSRTRMQKLPAIGILDDGAGMTEPELLEAMRPGSRNPLEDRTAIDLGRFGLGLKTASFSQCRRLTVVTRRRRRGVLCGMGSRQGRGARQVDCRSSTRHPAGSPMVRTSGCGRDTLVVWEKLDRLVGPDGGTDRRHLVRQLDETATHLEFVFHRFLSGKGEQGRAPCRCSSTVGRFVHLIHSIRTIPPPSIIQEESVSSSTDGRSGFSPLPFPITTRSRRATGSVMPEPEGYVKNQGILPVPEPAGSSSTAPGSDSRGNWNSHDCRVCASTSRTASTRNGRSTSSKASAQPPAPVRERLRFASSIASALRQGGRTPARGARLTDESRLPVWTRSQDKNRISYGLNLDHPLFSAFEARLDEDGGWRSSGG